MFKFPLIAAAIAATAFVGTLSMASSRRAAVIEPVLIVYAADEQNTQPAEPELGEEEAIARELESIYCQLQGKRPAHISEEEWVASRHALMAMNFYATCPKAGETKKGKPNV